MATVGAGRGNRGLGFDKEVRRVAPVIRRLQLIGAMTIADIAAALDAQAIAPPSGSHWSYGTARRVMSRAASLGLGVTERTLNSSRTFYRSATPKWIGVNVTASADVE